MTGEISMNISQVSNSVPMIPQAVEWLKGCRLPRRVAVGFSGGIDSTALLLFLHGAGHEVVAWHVDHGWRANSAKEADRLRRKMNIWGIEFHSARPGITSAGNREAAARKARYTQFLRWARIQGIRTLCLAHHRDDQAETVCMRMLQGAGVTGCAGMKPERKLKHMRIVRPLLQVPKSALKEALRQAGVGWLEDASNQDTALMRNHIRHDLFPGIRKVDIDPVILFGRWQQQAFRLAALLDAQANTAEIRRKNGMASVSWNVWREMPGPVRACVLQRMMTTLFCEGTVLGRRHIELAESWLRKGGKGGIDLSRCRLSHQGEGLHLSAVEVSLHR